jgi:hypothetical protein
MADPVTVAFPLIGGPVPTFPCPAEEFRAQVERQPPHWPYHVRVQASGQHFISHFQPVSGEQLRQLAARLGLPGGFIVDPCEFSVGAVPLWDESVSPYSFALPADFPNRSSRLALAVGLAAAATDRPLPPTVLFSGCLPDAFPAALTLTRTDAIADKVRLALGRGPGFQIEPVLARLYPSPYTVATLGPESSRPQSRDERSTLDEISSRAT